MVSHELVRWATTFLIDAADLDWGYILQFWDPDQHSGERMTENLDQILHSNTAKTLRPAASPWVILVFFCLGGGHLPPRIWFLLACPAAAALYWAFF